MKTIIATMGVILILLWVLLLVIGWADIELLRQAFLETKGLDGFSGCMVQPRRFALCMDGKAVYFDSEGNEIK